MIIPGIVGVVAATAAIWLQGRQRIDRRYFAGLLALAVTSSLFSVLGCAATRVARIVPLPLIWVFVGILVPLLAVRLYRELQVPTSGSRRLSRRGDGPSPPR
jgi:hypothetical protein